MEGWESPNHIANILVVPICSGTAHEINKFKTNVRHDEINSKKKKKDNIEVATSRMKIIQPDIFFCESECHLPLQYHDIQQPDDQLDHKDNISPVAQAEWSSVQTEKGLSIHNHGLSNPSILGKS